MPPTCVGTVMQAELFQCDVAIVGHWNPYIIQPDWLINSGVAHVAERDNIHQINFSIVPHQPLSFSFPFQGFDWSISENHLIVRSSTLQNPAPIVVEVLRRLAHTPVAAVGHNFKYRRAATARPT